jgi:hypothetical protein
VGTILDDEGISFWEFLQTGGTICHRQTARQSEGEEFHFLGRTGSALLVRQEGICICRSSQEGPLTVSRTIILFLPSDRRVLLYRVKFCSSVDRKITRLSAVKSKRSSLDSGQERLALVSRQEGT